MRTLCKKALALCVVFALALTCFVGTLSVSAADPYDATLTVADVDVNFGDTTATAVLHIAVAAPGINEAIINIDSTIGTIDAEPTLDLETLVVDGGGDAYVDVVGDDFSKLFLSARRDPAVTELNGILTADIAVEFTLNEGVKPGTYPINIVTEGVKAADKNETVVNLVYATEENPAGNFIVTCKHNNLVEDAELWVAPTCTKDGSKTFVCDDCKEYSYTEVDPATGHAEELTYTSKEDGTHSVDCPNCEDVFEAEDCADEDANGACDKCGYVFVTEPETFTVTFVDADGTVLKTEEVEAGAAATAPELPRKIAYSSNWDVDFSNIVSDTTVTAVYTAAVDTGCGLTGQISLESTFVFTFGIPDANYKGGTVLYAVVNKLYVENGETKYTEEVFEGEDFYAYDGDLCFNYAGIAAKEMTSDVKVRFYFEKDGVLQSSKEVVTCIAKMTLSQMKKTEALRTLGIDMLNYGAAAQIYFKYRQDSLANEYVSGTNSAASYADYATKTEPTFTEKTSSTGSWSYGMGMSLDLTLGNTIDMCFYPRVGTYLTDTGKDISTLKLVYEYTSVSGKYYTDSISADKWLEQSANEKLYIFNVLASKDLRVPVTVKIYDDENNLVSKTITTSVAAYAAKLTGADEAAVVAAMFRFSDSAVEYFK